MDIKELKKEAGDYRTTIEQLLELAHLDPELSSRSILEIIAHHKRHSVRQTAAESFFLYSVAVWGQPC